MLVAPSAESAAVACVLRARALRARHDQRHLATEFEKFCREQGYHLHGHLPRSIPGFLGGSKFPVGAGSAGRFV